MNTCEIMELLTVQFSWVLPSHRNYLSNASENLDHIKRSLIITNPRFIQLSRQQWISSLTETVSIKLEITLKPHSHVHITQNHTRICECKRKFQMNSGVLLHWSKQPNKLSLSFSTSNKEIRLNFPLLRRSLWSFHLWRYTKPGWTQPWVTCSTWPCSEQESWSVISKVQFARDNPLGCEKKNIFWHH